MNVKAIARRYLSYLEKGDVPSILSLFADDGIVVSPVYGTKPAKEFYNTLIADTQESIITFDGIFSEEGNIRIALLFDYLWILKDNKKVDFKVVDIIEFNTELEIKKLTIIYDTVLSRKLVKALK